ncbi:MAG TPA: hypothetical protein VNA15_04550 [Candidatus Angelobacter sp.]|nr:hypothetical protein [Candidatus Angelobacter sp.]
MSLFEAYPETLQAPIARIVPPHPRLRKRRRNAKTDYTSVWHSESEHKSHGEGSFERTR